MAGVADDLGVAAMPKSLFDVRSASEYLFATYGIRRSPHTLNKLRSIGGGPAFRRVGRARIAYEQAALDAWVREIASEPLRSTSQTAGAA